MTESLASDFVMDNDFYFHDMFGHCGDEPALKPNIVVGIDFGTAGTAFAIQFRTNYENNMHEIFYDKYLSTHGRKNSTSLLLSKNSSESYFGVEAENKYRRLQNRDGWYFFRHFKMQMYRDRTQQAGIESKYLTIALEPEVGAIYYAVTGANPPNHPISKMECPVHIGPGSTFMVVDIGAGTVDITTMTIMKNGKIKQIYESDGGPAGGENVDRKFINLVAKLFGENTWREFAKESSSKYAQFRDSVESAKKDLKPAENVGEIDDIFLYVPEEILRAFAQEQEETDLTSSLRKAGQKHKQRAYKGVGIEDGQLCFKADVLRQLMNESVEEILKFISKVISSEQRKMKDIHAVILIGGFALSNFLYNAIKKEIKSVTILRPWSCDKAVLRGAVLFGHNESILSVRKVRLTYGIKSFKPFKSGDPSKRKVLIDGEAYVKDCFSKHVTRGQDVHIDEWTPPREYKPHCNSESKTKTIYLYASNAHSPRYVDEDSCKSIGQLVLDFTRETDKLNLLDVSFNFGRTEILAKVTHRSSGVSTVGIMRCSSN
ncbi:heat shock 70 kDa protein 12B-like isoform X2 [Mercenaria mercenaria]|uniref:heat shock 70 kDa protein 12B-like isoform X2 n=1 Tax=Mercenaria mercenaria TaxID=6596 RepID=UPI00234EAB8B|nr:heat shock 70 kDa protein 12B-like isoform X2 [Mercenaria mercenaria]